MKQTKYKTYSDKAAKKLRDQIHQGIHPNDLRVEAEKAKIPFATLQAWYYSFKKQEEQIKLEKDKEVEKEKKIDKQNQAVESDVRRKFHEFKDSWAAEQSPITQSILKIYDREIQTELALHENEIKLRALVAQALAKLSYAYLKTLTLTQERDGDGLPNLRARYQPFLDGELRQVHMLMSIYSKLKGFSLVNFQEEVAQEMLQAAKTLEGDFTVIKEEPLKLVKMLFEGDSGVFSK